MLLIFFLQELSFLTSSYFAISGYFPVSEVKMCHLFTGLCRKGEGCVDGSATPTHLWEVDLTQLNLSTLFESQRQSLVFI